jgi:hypothetical protein
MPAVRTYEDFHDLMSWTLVRNLVQRFVQAICQVAHLASCPVQATSASIPEEGPDHQLDDVDTPGHSSVGDQSALDSVRTVPIRAFKSGSCAVPMSPSCMQPQEMAAQVLFAEQEIGRLQVELQAAHKREAQLRRELVIAQEDLVRLLEVYDRVKPNDLALAPEAGLIRVLSSQSWPPGGHGVCTTHRLLVQAASEQQRLLDAEERSAGATPRSVTVTPVRSPTAQAARQSTSFAQPATSYATPQATADATSPHQAATVDAAAQTFSAAHDAATPPRPGTSQSMLRASAASSARPATASTDAKVAELREQLILAAGNHAQETQEAWATIEELRERAAQLEARLRDAGEAREALAREVR